MLHSAMEALKNKEQAAAAVQRYAHLTADLGLVVAIRDKAVTATREKHQPLITTLSGQLTELKEALETWAKANSPEFGEKRSIEFSHGWLKLREGSRQLECLARWTWEKVLEKLQSFPPTSQWREYIRNNPEVNAQKLLEETKDGGRLPAARLKEVGLKIVREESFTIKTKPDAVANDCDLRV